MEIERRSYESFWEKGVHPDYFYGEPRLEHPSRKRIAEEAKKIGNSVLDVGCDSCVDYPRYKKSGMRYTGIDITEKFIRRAKDLYPGIDARVGTAYDLPFPDGSYDSVYCKDLLEHLPPEGYKQVLKEMWRVTRKLMMIAFYIPTNNKPTKYNLTVSGVYEQSYNAQEIADFIMSLKDFKGLEIERNRLYFARKK